MGLLNSLANGLSQAGTEAGKFFGTAGLEAIKKQLEEDKIRLVDQLAGDREIAKDERAITNIPRVQAATLPGEIEKMRAEGNVKVDVARRSPRTIAEGSTEVVEGVPGFTAPKTAVPHTQEDVNLKRAEVKLKEAMADYYQGAKANEAQARADKLSAGGEGKPIGPNIKPFKGESGEYLVDLNSGAIGVVVPGTPAKDAVWHMFKANEPATPEKLQRTAWSTADGQPLPGGPFSLYSQLPVNKQGGNTRSQQTPGTIYPQDIELSRTSSEARAKLAAIAGGEKQLDAIIADYDKGRGANASQRKPVPTSAVTQQGPSLKTGGIINDVEGAANLRFAPEWRLRQYAEQGNQRAVAELARRKNLYKDLPAPEDSGFQN